MTTTRIASDRNTSATATITTTTIPSLENEVANLSRRITIQLKSNGHRRQSEIIEHISAQFIENWHAGYQHYGEEDIPFLGLAVELGLELEKQLHALIGKAMTSDRLIVKLLLNLDLVLEQMVIRLDHFVTENEAML